MTSESDDRETILRQDGLLIGIALFSVVCGMQFSPYVDWAFIPVTIILGPAFLGTSPLLVFYFTSILVSATALVIGGIPAALFERLTGRERSDATSLAIWLAGVAIVALPALARIAG